MTTLKAYKQGYNDGVHKNGEQRRLDGSGPRPKMRNKKDKIGAYNQGRWDAANASEGQRATQRIDTINRRDTKPKSANNTKYVGKVKK